MSASATLFAASLVAASLLAPPAAAQEPLAPAPAEPAAGSEPATETLPEPVEPPVPGAFELPWWGELPELQAPASGAPVAPAAPGGPLGLDEVVALALERNPELQAVEERLDEVVGGIVAARAEALPQLSLVSSWSRSRNPAFLNSPDFEAILDQFPEGSFEPSEQELYRLSTELSQALYTFGKVGAGIELAELAGRIVESEIAAARLEVALEAAEAYFEVLAARRGLEVIEVQEVARGAALEVVEARFEIGEATLLERLRAQAALAEVAPAVVGLRGDLEVALARLRAVLALPPAAPLEVAAPAALEAAEALPEPPPLAELLVQARATRPELATVELERAALAKQQDITRADGKPQIELTGRYGREVRLLDNFTDPLYADWAVAVGLSWDFFDGGRRKGELAQIESQRQQLGWRLEALADAIGFEIEEALARYRTALARLDAAGAAARVAREARRVAEETYREGVSLQADLLDSQQREVEAEIALVDALAGARTEGARLARAVGRLPTAVPGDPTASAAPAPVPPDLPPSDPFPPSADGTARPQETLR